MSNINNKGTSNNLLDHALHLLQVATTLEEKSNGEEQKIEAATKVRFGSFMHYVLFDFQRHVFLTQVSDHVLFSQYYEAVYLVKQYLEELPDVPENKSLRQFLTEKASHYEGRASSLLGSAVTAVTEVATETATADSDCSVAVAVAVPIPTPASVALPVARAVSYRPITLQQLASQADARLTKAMDLDERQDTKAAIEEYMAAAELYLHCVKFVADQRRAETDAIKFKRLLKGTLGKCE
jgi:hypothetical protein